MKVYHQSQIDSQKGHPLLSGLNPLWHPHLALVHLSPKEQGAKEQGAKEQGAKEQ